MNNLLRTDAREVMKKISEPPFDVNRDCGTLCLQHKTNEIIWNIKASQINGEVRVPEVDMSSMPQHINFI